MKLTITVLCFSIMLACSSNPDQKTADSNSTDPIDMEENEILLDTISASFPVQIGNDKGSVKIVGERTFKNKELTSSAFLISLLEIQDFSISKPIDKEVLITSKPPKQTQNFPKSEYLDKAVIKSIKFKGVRSNTLYFNVLLENPIDGKEIIGRFNLFYRTKEKGTVYGWIIDEIKDTSANE